MVLRVNTDTPISVDQTKQTELKDNQTNEKQTGQNMVPIVDNAGKDQGKGVTVEHAEETEQSVDENAQQKKQEARDKKLAEVANAKSQSKRGLMVNMEETEESAVTASKPQEVEQTPATQTPAEQASAEPKSPAAKSSQSSQDASQSTENNQELEDLRKQIAEQQQQIQELLQITGIQRQGNGQPASNEAADSNEQADTPQPAEENKRLVDQIEDKYKYLVGKSSKKLKKVAKGDDEKAAEYAKQILAERAHDRVVWTPTELSDNERAMVEAAVDASGKDKPFYKNLKAQRILRKDLRDKNQKIVEALDAKIKEAKTKEEEDALKLYRDAFADKNLSRKQARTLVREMKIEDRVEHTVVVDSYKDKKEVRRQLGEEAGDFRIRRHSKKFLRDSNEIRKRMSNAEKAGTPISTHQAAYELLNKNLKGEESRISGDGTFERSEVNATATYGSTTYNAARRELKRLGYNVDDGRAVRIIAPLVTAATTAAAAYALPIVVEVTATALATATATAGGMTAISTAKASVDVIANVHPWKQAGIAGGTAGILSAIFGLSDSEEGDILRNIDRCYLFTKDDPKNFEMYRFDDDEQKDKAVKDVLRAIADLKLDEDPEVDIQTKIGLIKKAAGDRLHSKLSMKELILAYIDGMDMAAGAKEKVKPDTNCGGKCKENNDPDCNCGKKEKPVEEPVEKPVEKPVEEPVDNMKYKIKEETIGIPHKSGVFNGWSLATKAYVTLDGKVLTQKQIKELIDKIYTHNEVRRNGKYYIPKVWDLEKEITLSDGTVVRLKPKEEILAMEGPRNQENNAKVKLGAPREQTRAEGVVLNKHNKIVGDTIPGSSEEEVQEKILKIYPKAQKIDWTD